MSQTPNHPQISRADETNSPALDEYNKLSASGQFTPFMSSVPAGERFTYTPKPTAAPAVNPFVACPPPAANPPVPRFAAYPPVQRTTTTSPENNSPYAAPNGGPVLAYVPSRSNTASPHGNATHGLPLTSYLPPRLQAGHQSMNLSPYATGGQQSQPHLQPTHLPPSRANTASPPAFAANAQYAPPRQMAPAPIPSGHMPQFPDGNGHGPMPWLNRPIMPMPQPRFSPMAPGMITRDGLSARFQDLLIGVLPNWTSSSIVLLASHCTNTVIFLGKDGQLGDEGLQSYSDIFLGVGYENKGTSIFMCLAVEGALEVKVLLRTRPYAFKGGNTREDGNLMHRLKQGFYDVALNELRALQASMQRNAAGVRVG